MILLFFTLGALSAVQSLSLTLATKADTLLCNSTVQIEKSGHYSATIALKGDFSNSQTLLELQGKFAFHWPTVSLYGGLLTNRGALALLFDTKIPFATNAGSAVAITTPAITATKNCWQGVMLSYHVPQLELKIIPFGFVPLLGNHTPSGGGVVLLGNSVALGLCHLSQSFRVPEGYHINYFDLVAPQVALAVLALSTPTFVPFRLQFMQGTFSQALRTGFSVQRGYGVSLVHEFSLQFWDLQLLVNRCYEAPYPIQESTNNNERALMKNSFSLLLPATSWLFSVKGEQELFRQSVYANRGQKRHDTVTAHIQYNQQNWVLAAMWSHTLRWSESGRYTQSNNVQLSLKIDYQVQQLQIVLKGDPKELFKSQLDIQWCQDAVTIKAKIGWLGKQLTLAVQCHIQMKQAFISLTEEREVKATFTVQR